MPIYNGMLPAIDKAEVKRYAGLRHAEDFPENYVNEACKEIQLLATPKGVYQEYDYDAETCTILSNPPLKIVGSTIEKHLEKSTKVYVLGVTVGEDVEIRSEQLFKQGNYTVGLLLDAAATTAVEQVADQVNGVINTIAKKQGYKPTWRFSPGYGNWPLEIQTELANIIKTEQIGLQVTENFLLFPRKSVTAIIGLMPANEDINTKRGCTSCSQKDCTSRKLPEKVTTTTKETGVNTVNNANNTPCEKRVITADISDITTKGQPESK